MVLKRPKTKQDGRKLLGKAQNVANKEATLLLRIKSAGEDVLDRIRSKFVITFGDAINMAKQLANALAAPIEAYREQEEATNSLSRAMINQGIYSKELKQAYLDQATSLQKLTLYGDEQIIGAQAVLQGYLGQTKVSEQLTKATLDLATAKKMDLASAAEVVGKAIGTSTNALARQGIEVDANATKQEKLAQVLTGINKQWGGQAEAAASGLGALTQLKTIFGELVEDIGKYIAPVIILFANKLKDIGTDAQSTGSAIQALVSTLQVLTQAGVIVSGVLEALGKIIGTTVAGAVEVLSEAVNMNFSKAFEASGRITQQWQEDVTSSYANTARRMEEVDAAFLAGKQNNLALEEKMEKEARAKRREVQEREEAEKNNSKLEKMIEQQELEMEILAAGEEQKEMVMLNAEIKRQEAILAAATDAHSKLAAQNEIYRLNEEKKEMIANETRAKNRAATLNTIATLQNSHNKELAMVGKAAAITQIAIETPVAIAKALSAFPPPFNFAAAGLVGVAMAAQAASIAGVQLAEGGIVMPRPGGIQATIGEGGQAEAVIPLDRAGEFGMGGSTTVVINSYGGMLGSESEAREFAKAVDRALLDLRRNHESVAFDSGVV